MLQTASFGWLADYLADFTPFSILNRLYSGCQFLGPCTVITVITLCFRTLNIIISVKNRGCPKTKGVRKNGVITVLRLTVALQTYVWDNQIRFGEMISADHHETMLPLKVGQIPYSRAKLTFLTERRCFHNLASFLPDRASLLF